MGRYKVAEATQVNVDGAVHGPGETVELDDEQAGPLLAAGTIVEAPERSKRVSSAENKQPRRQPRRT